MTSLGLSFYYVRSVHTFASLYCVYLCIVCIYVLCVSMYCVYLCIVCIYVLCVSMYCVYLCICIVYLCIVCIYVLCVYMYCVYLPRFLVFPPANPSNFSHCKCFSIQIDAVVLALIHHVDTSRPVRCVCGGGVCGWVGTCNGV